MFHQPKMTTLQLMCGVSRGAAQPPGVFEELAMASIPTTAHLQAFEAVARRRSFALAASELHLTASAVSHQDRKSTRLNSSHSQISYAVFCLKKKKKQKTPQTCMYHIH